MKIIDAQRNAPHVLTQFEETASRLDTIPTVPVVARKLMALTASADYSMDEVEELISSDQALAIRLMRIASSASFSPRAVTSVRGALIRVGMRNVRKLVLAAAVIGGKLSPLHKAVWVHSLRVASTAEALSDVLARPIEDPFICGLLHDFGIVALDRLLGSDYRDVIATPCTDEHLESERANFGFDHGDMGAILAREWNLFPTLVSVMQLHHDPLHAPEVVSDEAADAVYAIALARDLVLDVGRLEGELDITLCERLGISVENAAEVATVGEEHFTERYSILLGES